MLGGEHTIVFNNDINYSIQCIRKVFRPLDFFHILLRYSLILKYIQLLFFLVYLHTIPHNDKVKTGCYNFLYICYKYKKQKYLIYISIQTRCYETQS